MRRDSDCVRMAIDVSFGSLFVAMTLVLLALKVAGIIDQGWAVVLMPIWMPVALQLMMAFMRLACDWFEGRYDGRRGA